MAIPRTDPPPSIEVPSDVIGLVDPSEVAALAQQYAGGGGTQQAPMLYWGPGFARGQVNTPPASIASTGAQFVKTRGGLVVNQGGAGDQGLVSTPTTKTVDDAVHYLENLLLDDPKAFYDIGDTMVRQGYLKAGYDKRQVLATWAAAAQQAASYYSAGRQVTIREVLDQWAPASNGGISDLAGSQTGAPRLVKSTSSQANISSKSQIKGAARDVSANALGRDLSDDELDRLVTKVQAAQNSSPTITNTRSKYDAEGRLVNQSQTTHGGVDPNTVIEDQLRDNPDYAEHQAAAFFLPLLMQAIGSTV